MAFLTSPCVLRARHQNSLHSPRRQSTFAPAFLPCPRLLNTNLNLRMAREERTFIAVKPDGMNRGLLGNIISRFEAKGFKLVAIKTLVPSRQLAETHYAALSAKPFFSGLVDFIISGPVCAMIWEGEHVVKAARTMIGATSPLESAPGTIRGDFAVDVGRK